MFILRTLKRSLSERQEFFKKLIVCEREHGVNASDVQDDLVNKEDPVFYFSGFRVTLLAMERLREV